MSSLTPPTPRPPADASLPPTYDDEEISLRPYLATIWRYRAVLWAAIGLVVIAFAIVVLALWVKAPTERLSTVQFRLLFEGAAEGKYPNGAPFSPTEIVGAPVVTAVFKANDLQRYGAYEGFKEALFVQQSNQELDLLALEYQAKLADMKLDPVDRARIEDEFKKKREALADPSFSLSLRRSGRFTVLPRELAQKVLTDTLAVWAENAALRKGALMYQVPMLSASILSRESLDTDDYLVAADQLRAKAVRVIRTIEKLERLPGALNIRTAKDDVSLSEIRASLEDAIRFDLEPLLGIIRSEGVTKNPRLLSLYATNMVFQLRLDKQETEARARAIQTNLREYVAQTTPQDSSRSQTGTTAVPARPGTLESTPLIPQLSDSFLARLQQMAAVSQKEEMEYRRKLTDQVIDETRQAATFDKELQYYEDLAASLTGVGARSGGSAELVALIKARSLNAFGTIEKAMIQLSALHQELSAQNLDPAARLFAITGPFSQHAVQSLPIRPVVLTFLLVIFLTVVTVPLGCLVYDSTRPRIVRTNSGDTLSSQE